jgi:hypothetical protein
VMAKAYRESHLRFVSGHSLGAPLELDWCQNWCQASQLATCRSVRDAASRGSVTSCSRVTERTAMLDTRLRRPRIPVLWSSTKRRHRLTSRSRWRGVSAGRGFPSWPSPSRRHVFLARERHYEPLAYRPRSKSVQRCTYAGRHARGPTQRGGERSWCLSIERLYGKPARAGKEGFKCLRITTCS